MPEFASLNLESINLYQTLIPEQVLREIQQTVSTPESKVIGYTACCDHEIVGIILALFISPLRQVDVLHIFVDPRYRNQQIGRTLLAKVQEETMGKGANIFSLIYSKELPEAICLEKILSANHWNGIRPFMIRCEFDLHTFNPPWLFLDYDYPAHYNEFYWRDLTPEDRLDLERQEQQESFSSIFSPFREEEKIEFFNSLGIRHEGRIIGWMMTHRLDFQTVRYSCLYTHPSFHFHAIAIKMLSHAILLHKEHPEIKATMEVPLIQVHPSWGRFVTRRLLPYATKVTLLNQAWKIV